MIGKPKQRAETHAPGSARGGDRRGRHRRDRVTFLRRAQTRRRAGLAVGLITQLAFLGARPADHRAQRAHLDGKRGAEIQLLDHEPAQPDARSEQIHAMLAFRGALGSRQQIEPGFTGSDAGEARSRAFGVGLIEHGKTERGADMGRASCAPQIQLNPSWFHSSIR